jgi:hypothetical protein
VGAPGPHDLAVVEALGALTYGQLRAFAVTARSVVRAPSAKLADRMAGFAEGELAAYRQLRGRLGELTDLGDAAMDRQRDAFDLFFDGDNLGAWSELCTLFAIGLPLAADFAGAIAPHFDEVSAQVVVDALGTRQEFEQWATDQLSAHLDQDPKHRDEVRHVVAGLAGRMLTGFQRVIVDTDALSVLLAGHLHGDAADDSAVRHLAVDVLGSHRARMIALGLEDDDA